MPSSFSATCFQLASTNSPHQEWACRTTKTWSSKNCKPPKNSTASWSTNSIKAAPSSSNLWLLSSSSLSWSTSSAENPSSDNQDLEACYSYRKLSTGSSCAARAAGTVPKITPTTEETTIA